MIDFRAIIEIDEIYKHRETRIEYALVQKPYLSTDILHIESPVYTAVAYDSFGNEVRLEWHDNIYAELGEDEATDFDLFDCDNFKVIVL